MSPLMKAVLIPFVRILQVVAVVVLIAFVVACIYGIVVWEKRLFDWNWRAFTIVNVIVIYICIVWYCLEKRSKWWP